MPLGRGKSGKEARCCLRPPDDPYPTACPAAWEVLFHTVTARPRSAGHAYARSKGKPGSLPTDTGLPFAVSDPASTPSAPPHGECLSRLRLFAPSHASGRAVPILPLLPPNPPHSKKQDTPSGVSCFLWDQKGVMPWQNGSDRNISRYSGGTVRCNVPPDRHAAA